MALAKRIDTFHEGEILLQDTVLGPKGGADHRDMIKDFIRTSMPEQHVSFFNSLPWLVVGSLDSDGSPRASILQATAGSKAVFTAGKGNQSFKLNKATATTGDPFIANAAPGRPVGLLGIELHTRRRNRVNGYVSEMKGQAIQVKVQHSFGNCPKYIQARSAKYTVAAKPPSRVVDIMTESQTLEVAQKLFAKADTVFIATGNTERGVDISHRGGRPGFIQVAAPTKKVDAGAITAPDTAPPVGSLPGGVGGACLIRMPDFPGNHFFNTFGNIVIEPRVGLLVLDFDTGNLYQVAGRAVVRLAKDPDLPGSERVVDIAVDKIIQYENALLYTFSRAQPSPFNPPLSSNEGDELRMVRVMQETADTKTILFHTPRPLLYRAGQYGSFRVTTADGLVYTRAWTLSSTPSGPFGEDTVAITVKHKPGGRVSSLIHAEDASALGKLTFHLIGIEGSFVLPKEPLPTGATILMVAAGSGITPVMSMLRSLPDQQPGARVVLLYSVKKLEDAIFLRDIVSLTKALHMEVIVKLTKDDRSHRGEGNVKFIAGRVTEADKDLVAHLKRSDIALMYVCGPSSFSRAVEDIFYQLVPGNRIITESFDY